MTEFSDYIVYADESGDHGLVSINPEYPVFALVFCAIRKADYAAVVVPAFQSFKFDIWGHDAVVLHEQEIRRREGDFTVLLTDPNLRARFFERLNGLIESAPVTIFASVIDKLRLKKKYADPQNPYEIALLFCMEQLLDMLIREGQAGKTVHVVFESRGKREDRDLELEFRRICNNERQRRGRNPDFRQLDFRPIFQAKSVNSTGLQLADLTARPIALNSLRPNQVNRAFEIIRPKLGGLKCFP